MAHSLVIILVLYKKKISQTPNYKWLAQMLETYSTLHLFVYDNSPMQQEDAVFFKRNVHYKHNAKNPGLAEAYNEGIVYGTKEKAELFLLLDQDTTMTPEYVQRLLFLSLDDKIAVYVPIVKANNKQISPLYATSYVGRYSEFPPTGLAKKQITAINSGTVLTKQAVAAIGGRFNQEFPLDFLDHWFFWFLSQKQMTIMVLKEELIQQLSVLDYQAMTKERYQSIVSSETRFYQNYDRTKLNQHKKHLFLRAIKQFFLVKNRIIWQLTISELFKLLKGK
ncbi:glycosyltransferase [Melissococcus plutonius]|uniref:Glycosyl transferase, group 2 family n=1 Tax=Melissococcus plutonius TaxID=33970 RepID=A0A2Z5Y2Y8_9ENTE|nr:glycosyltransferase [Melissococcus plutonius]BAL62359.1 glycosyl transferase, group 2 family protein [Melissococcus plutonius DAT561]MCV2498127.1 glycosyltransferase [Melissococcus plutonius]MCV2501452.1 glycosyltransferase [Melissococcus plutonius]MCV2504321.1 glycosyltransferase [Melissococcus plutonius]MCV2506742.1 glycosyltransferase [Melissococcus plutonius]